MDLPLGGAIGATDFFLSTGVIDRCLSFCDLSTGVTDFCLLTGVMDLCLSTGVIDLSLSGTNTPYCNKYKDQQRLAVHV